MKKLGIIIPVYNTEKYIKKCLESIIKQKNDDVEIIVIDDKSTDNSLKIIKETIKNTDIKLIENDKNYGISYSRNIGLINTNSEYIYFVDSDDYLNDNAIEVILNNLDSDILKFSYNKKILLINKPVLVKNNNYNIKDNKELLYLEDCFVWNKVFKRELIINNLFEKIKYEDLPFTLTALIDADKIKSIPDILYNYRMNVNSVTFKDRYMPDTSVLDIFDANDYLDLNLKKRNLLEEYKQILKDIHIYHSMGTVITTAFWLQLSKKQREQMVMSLLNYIKNKYEIENLYNTKLIKERSEKNTLYYLRLKYIKKLVKDIENNDQSKELVKKY